MEPKIGLALSSGSARGFAHAGVIKALMDAGIAIDMIAGSSMGALVGGCYAASLDIDHLIKFAVLFNRNRYLDVIISRKGLIKGDKVQQLMQLLTHGKNIEALKKPIAIVATDLVKGEKVVFRTGSTAEAIRASISVPGIFVPVEREKQVLVDGGAIDWLPVPEVQEMGADIVIASDVAHWNHQSEIVSVFDVISRSLEIIQENAKRFHLRSVDVFIQPNLSKFSASAFTNIQEMITMGEVETKKHLPRIRQVIADWKEKNS